MPAMLNVSNDNSSRGSDKDFGLGMQDNVAVTMRFCS